MFTESLNEINARFKNDSEKSQEELAAMKIYSYAPWQNTMLFEMLSRKCSENQVSPFLNDATLPNRSLFQVSWQSVKFPFGKVQ